MKKKYIYKIITHYYNQEAYATDDQSVPDELEQCNVREEIFNIIRQIDDSLMSINQNFNSGQRCVILGGNLQEALPHDVNLTAYVQYLECLILQTLQSVKQRRYFFKKSESANSYLKIRNWSI